MFELLYFNQFSSFIVQLRSVNWVLQNKWMNGWMDEWMNERNPRRLERQSCSGWHHTVVQVWIIIKALHCLFGDSTAIRRLAICLWPIELWFQLHMCIVYALMRIATKQTTVWKANYFSCVVSFVGDESASGSPELVLPFEGQGNR